MDVSLALPAFIAGLLTFLAPCTLPLVPGYLGFISGTSAKDFQNETKRSSIRRRVFLNGLMYVLGFTIVFMLMGTLFGLLGSTLSAHRFWLARAGGAFVMFFGLYLMHVFDHPFFGFLNREKRFSFWQNLTPGKPSSSLIFGATFAFGWTPCIGPILGSILILASTSAHALQGAFLLFVFSLGLAVPFLLIAFGVGHAVQYIKRLSRYLNAISILGGAFLVFLGVLILTDNLAVWISYFYQWFDFLNYDAVLDYL